VTRVKGLVAAAPDPVRCVVFDLQAVTTMDITAVETFGELCAELTDAGIDYRIAHANRPLREKLMRVGATQTMGAERFFHATWEAVEDWVERGAKGLPPGPHAAH
jgi:SulP family sulfate permease